MINSKLSVIIPVYNSENYLVKCLNSIVNQTLNEIEIIIVNDGSTDNSQLIIDEFKSNDSRIISIEQLNGGLGAARNKGIESASGEYIAFVDSDDYVDLSMFEKMYELAIRHQADIIFCDLVKVDDDGNEFRILTQSPQLSEKIVLEEDFTIFGEMSCFACNKIFKKSLFDKHRFINRMHFEDIELIPKLVLDSKIISKINEPFYKYFERTNSITRTHTEKGLDIFIAIENVTNYFKESSYCNELNELKRFQIIQGYYSYLAYLAFVDNKYLKKEMIIELIKFLNINNISKRDIYSYKRFGTNYLCTLKYKKIIFYILSLIDINLLYKINLN